MSTDNLRVKRKIQQLGSSTLAVTLPAEWVREQELDKGDKLVVQRDETGGSLLVVPEEPSNHESESTIDAGDMTAASLRRAVIGQYVLGRQLIRIENDGPFDPDTLDAVAEVERRLMGLGVVEDGIDTITIRCSVDPGDFGLPTLMERLWRTEETMRTETVSALLTDDLDAARRSQNRQRQVEKLLYLFLRLVFTTYKNPRLNHCVGLETGFPLIGYRSVAQDIILMSRANREVSDLLLDAEGFDLDEATAAVFESVTDRLDRLASVTRRAVTEPSTDTSALGHEIVTEFEREVADAQSHLEEARPEPLLALQRTLTTFEKSGGHASDSLDVATHFASRSTPTILAEEE